MAIYGSDLLHVLTDHLMPTIERPVGDERHPFMMRLLSFDNLLAPPIDHYCPVLARAASEGTDGVVAAGSEQTAAAGVQGAQVCVTNTSPGVEFSVADRFNGHKVRTYAELSCALFCRIMC
jgi:hypothetical protein